jgi:hypothetical protein
MSEQLQLFIVATVRSIASIRCCNWSILWLVAKEKAQGMPLFSLIE